MPKVMRIGNSELRPSHPFFAAETAAAILVIIERILPPRDEPIPLSKDMPASPPLDQIFTSATQLSHEQNMKQVEPLHLLGSLLDQESERSSEILKQVGVSKEAVIAELRSS